MRGVAVDAAGTAYIGWKVNEAIAQGGDFYLRYRQIEMLPQIAPSRPSSTRTSVKSPTMASPLINMRATR